MKNTTKNSTNKRMARLRSVKRRRNILRNNIKANDKQEYEINQFPKSTPH